ncbi:DUF4062 domain-containing protein [Bacillus cereus]|uniref:DUF4062 domain-containing protein n=1 Tax=Bacillus cereus TaxID=1396 RepID=UPI000BFE107B|nr:DUF4062 domain-containing protein [Bacillus cereus]PGY17205.1 hypothetical protein COE23_08360 [Bacillus cereus]
MQKKLQVFISSTFTDLEEERQTAVQAVLNAGHIPAGMELFKAGDTSQKETIKKWIEESDVYMLILGGRYGSIDSETGMSYTHWEYEYAKQLKKPRFAIVIHEKALEQKVMELGLKVTERDNPVKYQEFRGIVLGKISKFYSDLKDIKIVILESLKEYEKDKKLTGWVSGAEIKDVSKLMKDNDALLKETAKLQKQLQQMKIQVDKENDIDGIPFNEVRSCLEQQMLRPDEYGVPDENLKGKEFSAYDLFIGTSSSFASGITNQSGNHESELFLYQRLAPILMQFNLVEKEKLAGVRYQRIQTSKAGLKFLRLVTLENSKVTI